MFKKKNQLFSQFIKFLIVGFNNTSIDFLILNLLMWFFNIYRGEKIIFLNITAFFVAVTHSYLVNRFWTFSPGFEKKITISQIILLTANLTILFNLLLLKNQTFILFLLILYLSFVIFLIFFIFQKFFVKQKQFPPSGLQFVQFVIISLIGVFLNTSTVYLLTTYFPPLLNLSQVLWANFAKVIATILVMNWNFAGYKWLVFKK